MILAIDVGNTNIVIGCLEDDRILFVERLSTDATRTELEYAIIFKNALEMYSLKPDQVEGSIMSSVVPPVTNIVRDAMLKITGKDVMVIGPGVKTGLNILMDNPAQLGSDLVANAVAGIAEYQVPLILIDMGTATTISIVDAKKNYIGGMIIPGVNISSSSLTSRTSQLPKISLDAPKKLIGTNTIDCMKSGLIHGTASCIDGMITRIEKDLGQKATSIATGGVSRFIIPHCTKNIIHDDALLLKGLMLIYNKNQANEKSL